MKVDNNSLQQIFSKDTLNVHQSTWQLEFNRIDGGGVINPIFHIRRTNGELCKEYMLKVGNPHPFWKKIKVECEVASIQLLASKTTVPVPKIIVEFVQIHSYE